MRKFLLLFVLVACKDGDCGRNSDDAEKEIEKQFGGSVTCIADDDDTFSCADLNTEKLYRCANSGTSRIKCIPWFPTE